MVRVMIMLSVVGLAAFVACGYGASFGDCTISCASLSDCPSGFTCSLSENKCRSGETDTLCSTIFDAGTHDTGNGDGGVVDATCPDDMDCDGVSNETDNCLTVPNPDQHDEDLDGLGDKCDPCPPYVDNTDTDGDGVGDLCDPNPNAIGDKLFAFEGFPAGVPTGWSIVGAWSNGGQDDLLVSAGSATASLTILAPLSGHETVSASVTVVAAPSGAASDISVVDDDAPASDSGISCRLYSNGTTTPYLWLSVGTPTTLYQMTVGVTYVLRERRLTSEFDCHAEHLDGTSATDTASRSSTLDNASPQIGLRIADGTTTARYQWVMIVSSP